MVSLSDGSDSILEFSMISQGSYLNMWHITFAYVPATEFRYMVILDFHQSWEIQFVYPEGERNNVTQLI
jgi:hypothetical protein